MKPKDLTNKVLQHPWLNVIPPFFKQKYMLTGLVFVFWLSFIDSNNFFQQWESMRELHKMKEVREYYKNKVQENSDMLHELKTNPEVLERYAREEYLMKRTDEDLFLVEE